MRPRKCKSSGRQMVGNECAFTLIELLVVIAVIAILAGMLLPALNAAKKRAVSSQCISNLKQYMVYHHSYAGDHEGKYMVFSMEDGRSAARFYQRTGYLKNLKFSLCPSSSSTDIDYYSYGCKRVVGGTGVLRSFANYHGANKHMYFAAITRITTPQIYFMNIDSRTSNINQQMSVIRYCTSSTTDNLTSLAMPIHSGRYNLNFLDGHVEGIDSDRFIYIVRREGKYDRGYSGTYVVYYDKNHIARKTTYLSWQGAF